MTDDAVAESGKLEISASIFRTIKKPSPRGEGFWSYLTRLFRSLLSTLYKNNLWFLDCRNPVVVLQ